MKILITGGAGLVGSQLFGYDKKSVEYNWNYLARYENVVRIKENESYFS